MFSYIYHNQAKNFMGHVWNKETIAKSFLIILFLSAFLFVYEGATELKDSTITGFATGEASKERVQLQGYPASQRPAKLFFKGA